METEMLYNSTQWGEDVFTLLKRRCTTKSTPHTYTHTIFCQGCYEKSKYCLHQQKETHWQLSSSCFVFPPNVLHEWKKGSFTSQKCGSNIQPSGTLCNNNGPHKTHFNTTILGQIRTHICRCNEYCTGAIRFRLVKFQQLSTIFCMWMR